MNKLFTKIAAGIVGIAMAIGVGVAVGGKQEVKRAEATPTTVASFSRSGTTNTITGGTFNGSNAESKTGYYQDGSGTKRYIEILNNAAYWTVLPESISLTAVIGGGSGNTDLTNPVYSVLLDSKGDEIVSSLTSITSRITTNTGDTYSNVSIPNTNNVYGVRIYHNKETGYNVRYYSFSLSFVAGSSKTVSSIDVALKNSTKVWYADEVVKPSDLSVTVNYSEGDPLVVTNGTGVTITSGSSLTAGDGNTVNVSYTDLYGTKTGSVTINGVLAARTIENVTLTGDLSKKTYNNGDDWDLTGLTVTIDYNVGEDGVYPLSEMLENSDFDCDLTPAKPSMTGRTLTIENAIHLGFDDGSGVITDKTINGIVVLNSAVTINFDSGSGHFNLSSETKTYADGSQGSTKNVTVTTDATSFTSNASYIQVGSSSNKGKTVSIAISLGSKLGIKSLTVIYCASGASSTVDMVSYGNSAIDNFLSPAQHSGNSSNTTATLSPEYEGLNASTINVVFSPSDGVRIVSISYQTRNQYQEFGTFSSLAVQTMPKNTIFKVGDPFSSAGLVLRATDTTGFTRDYNSNFTTDYDGHTFVVGEIGMVEVTATITIGGSPRTATFNVTCIEKPTYTKISSQSDLFEGAKVIFSTSGGYGPSSFNASNYYNVTSAMTFSSTTITDSKTAVEFTVRIVGGKIAFERNEKLISFSGASGGNAYEVANTSFPAAVQWEITASGIASVASSGYYLEYNSGASKIAAYKATQTKMEVYLSNSSTNTKTDAKAAETFIYQYLHMRDYLGTEGENGSNYCKNTGDGAGKNYFTDAATAYAPLSTEIKTEFKKNAAAVKRFQDWATANGKTIDLDTGEVSSSRTIAKVVSSETNHTEVIIVIVSLVSLTAIGGYFFLRKKKEQ